MPDSKTTTSEDEWTTVIDETPTRVVWENPGEQFIGVYVGHLIVNDEKMDEKYDYVLFRGTNGVLYSMSNSYKLRESFGDGLTEESGPVTEGLKVRLRYVKDVPMQTGRNPMRDIAVDVAATQ